MAKDISYITHIDAGIQPAYYRGGTGQYLRAKGVDPNFDVDGMLGGAIYPTKYVDFSSTLVNDIPYKVIANPVTSEVFAFAATSGHIVTYTDALASESSITSTSITQWGWYYNNYIYYMDQDSVGYFLRRYGPLSASLANRSVENITSEFWGVTSVNGGPNRLTINSVSIPRFVGHVHEGSLYISHVRSGVSVLSKVSTGLGLKYETQTGAFTAGLTVTGGTSGATALIVADQDNGTTGVLTITNVQGTFADNEFITDSGTGNAFTDTIGGATNPVFEGLGNNSSSFNVIDLPSNLVITDIDSVALDLGILTMPSGMSAGSSPNTSVRQGKSYFFLWDGSSDSYYRPIPIEYAYASAIESVSGDIFLFAGDVGKGTHVLSYSGGTSLQEILFLPFSQTPMATATDNLGGRVVFSGNDFITQDPCVYSLGMEDPRLGKYSLHCIARPSNADADTISSVSVIQQTAGLRPEVIIGWVEDEGGASEDYGIDKLTTGDSGSIFHGPMYNVGYDFTINTVLIPLATPLAANMEFAVKLVIDNESSISTIATVNTTNYPVGENLIRIECAKQGRANFYLAIEWSGTVACPLALPIGMTVNVSPT